MTPNKNRELTMNISELEKLAALHQSGALSAEEFLQAKAKLLNADSNKDSLGKAAHRGVTAISVAGVIVVLLMLAFFFGFFLPAWNQQQAAMEQHQENFKERWNSVNRQFANDSLTLPGGTANDGLAAKQ
jgi:cytochrome c-type biogenesis protein CcmH/NrfG